MLSDRKDPKSSSFLGTGWSFPPTFNQPGGQVEMVAGEADIVQSILIILGTEFGERLMQPNFGCGLGHFVFEAMEQGVLTSIESAVTDALIYHEPRIKVNQVGVEPDAGQAGLLRITIDYTVRQTNSRTNMVYPFYLNEATDAAL